MLEDNCSSYITCGRNINYRPDAVAQSVAFALPNLMRFRTWIDSRPGVRDLGFGVKREET